MRIAYLAAGAGEMYCGSCLHDQALAEALLAAGHDVVLVPLYTPLKSEEDDDLGPPPIFLGGANIFLQDRFALFRHTPGWIDRWLDNPGVLRWLARRGGSVDPSELGGLTESTLEAEEGRLKKEHARLIAWIRDELKPELVHLSNALLIGLARSIRRDVGVPVVANLSGEDAFLERIPEPHYSRVRQLLRERADDVDAFVALNRYYADRSAEYFSAPRDRIHVIPHGVLTPPVDQPEKVGEVFTIGFLARVCPDKGLHHLAAAFEHLSRRPGLPPIKLRAAGYLSPADRPYLDEVRNTLAKAGLSSHFEYLGELTLAQKTTFLSSLDVLSLPTDYRESKGLPALEALAHGVPVVLPEHGAFPELIADTQGGLLHPPGDATALADVLARLALDGELARRLGRQGREAVRQRYNREVMAARTVEIYERLLKIPRPGGA